MDKINITGTDDVPSVILDASTGKFEMSGRSLPEDVSAFYKPILDWMAEYAENANPKTVFDFKLTYFNTASSKIILDILMQLEEMANDGKEVLIKWHYPSDDEDMEEAGEEYSEIVDVPFEKVSY
ncbi:MAG: nuclear pore complex subunit [Bacteroidetes bacterium GWA2_31_9]|nr:MAG: nuclear pore complex subunit [Bacteroidetes bacterium GWA2_31_9]